MPYPPVPVIPALLLAVAAKLGWRMVVRDVSGDELGELIDSSGAVHHLVIARGDAPGTCQWVLVTDKPRGFDVHHMTRSTFDILRGGELQVDGAVMYRGAAYRFEALSLDGLHRADAIGAEERAA